MRHVSWLEHWPKHRLGYCCLVIRCSLGSMVPVFGARGLEVTALRLCVPGWGGCRLPFRTTLVTPFLEFCSLGGGGVGDPGQ